MKNIVVVGSQWGDLRNNLRESVRMIVKRAIKGMLIGLVAVVLNACGPVPKPFQTPAELGLSGLIQRDINGGVWVSIVDGSSAPGPNLLSEAIAQGLLARGIPAMTKGGGSLRYKLTGRVTERAPDQSGAAGIKIYWSLNEQNNKPVFYFSQDVRKDWFMKGSSNPAAESSLLGNTRAEIIVYID